MPFTCVIIFTFTTKKNYNKLLIRIIKMKLLKNYILVTFFLTFTTVLLSQQKAPKVNPELMAGIIMYDADEAIKKIKIKKEPQKFSTFKAISFYNNKINEIKTFNYLVFNDVKSFITKKTNEVKLTNDYRSMKEARLKIQEMLDPIRSKVKVQDSILNTNLEKELTAKQYKKWVKYKKIQLKKLQPKAPERPQSQRNSQGIGRRGQGQGQRRY